MRAKITHFETTKEGIVIRAIAENAHLINLPVSFQDESRIIGNVMGQNGDEITILLYRVWERIENQKLFQTIGESLNRHELTLVIEGNHIMLQTDEIDSMFGIQHDRSTGADSLDEIFGVSPIQKHPEYTAVANSPVLKNLEKELEKFFDK